MEPAKLEKLRATLERIDAHIDPATGQRGAGAASQPFLRELAAAVDRAEAEPAAHLGGAAPVPETQEVKTLPEAQRHPGLSPATSQATPAYSTLPT